MANESIGGVSVAITGDLGPLKAAFATAQASAQQAGAGVAEAFNAGAGTVGTLETAIVELTAAIRTLNVTLGQSGVASQVAATGQRAHAAAIHGTVSEIQATSGALRVLEGSGGIRAAERFLTMIPGLGAALQFAFPVIGLIALGSAMNKAAEEAIGLKEAEEALKKATEDSDAAFEKDLSTIERVNIAMQAMQFGAASGKKLEGFYTQQSAARDLSQVHALNLEIAAMETRASQFHFSDMIPHYGAQVRQGEQDAIAQKQREQDSLQSSAEGKDRQAKEQIAQAAKDAAQQAGQLGAQRITNEQQANARITEIERARVEGTMALEHAAEQQRIAGLASEYDRVQQTAAEEIRVAKEKQATTKGFALATRDTSISEIGRKAGAESAGKSQPEQSLVIAKAQGEVLAAKDAYTKAVVDSQNVVDAAEQKGALSVVELNQKVAASLKNLVTEGWDKASKAAKDTSDEFVKATDASLATTAKVMEIQAKSQGDTGALALQGQKLLLERAYGLEVFHTGGEEIAQQMQIAAIDNQARTAKLTGLAAELQAAQGIKDNQVQIAEITAKMVALSAQDANASIAAATKILQLEQQRTLQYQIRKSVADAAKAVPGAVGGALAQGVVNGKGIGQDISNALKGVGQQLLGSVFSRLISTILLQIGSQTGLIVATTANTGVTTVHAGVMLGHMGVMITHTAVMVAHLIAIVAQTLATWALAAIEAIKAFFGFAEGGSPPIGVPSIVGEKGAELFIPREAGVIIPNNQLGASAGGSLPSPTGLSASSSSSSSIGEMHFHIHGAKDTRETVRAIATYLRSASPKFSPQSS